MVILPRVFNKTLTGYCLYKAFIIILCLDMMLVVELTLNRTVYHAAQCSPNFKIVDETILGDYSNKSY